MKKTLRPAVIVTAFAGALAYAKSQGVAVAANILTGKSGAAGLLDSRGALAANTSVTTGRGGVLGVSSARVDRPAVCSVATAAAGTDV